MLQPLRKSFTASIRTWEMCGMVGYGMYLIVQQGVAKVLNHYVNIDKNTNI